MIKKKSLGQNFLNSPAIIADIVRASGAAAVDTVLEIGPGEGTLTRGLLDCGATVIAVEKDDRLIPILSETFAQEIADGRLKLIHGDILTLDVSKVTFDIEKYKIVANIPYYITGQIIRMFLESSFQPSSMTLLVQKEVADRIIARDGKESLLSLSIKAFGDPHYVRTVGRGAFAPQPNVDSAVIHIADISKNRLVGCSEKDFFTLLHAGFAHKRKQLLPNLASVYPKETVTRVFETLNLDLKCRAEDLPLEIWVQLASKLKD
jgi:16S rRNA (adenine1518-N6/adenine1519-N6)-dimethyltransferase